MTKVLAIVAGINPCSELGVTAPFRLLSEKGEFSFKLSLAAQVRIRDILLADVIVFQRNCERLEMLYIDLAQKLEKKIIYDIDDYLIKVPKKFGKIAEFYNSPEIITNIKYFLKKADIVKAGSPALCNALMPFANNVVYFPHANVDEYYQPVEHSKDGYLRFVIIVTPDMHDFLNSGLLDVIKDILLEYRGRVKFLFLGDDNTFNFDDVDVEFYPRMTFDEYVKFFSKLNVDAGIVYLSDNFFNRCKTNNKFREFSARGITGIYNNIPVYANCIINYETGVLVDGTPYQYSLAIRTLVNNVEMTKKIGQSARSYAEQHYRMESYASNWKKLICSLSSQKRYHIPVPCIIFISLKFYFILMKYKIYKIYWLKLYYKLQSMRFSAAIDHLTKFVLKKLNS